jgi:hypothetical protein
MVNEQAMERRFRVVSQPPKEFGVDRIPWGERTRGPRQKLPSTAIYCHLSPQNHYDRFNASRHFLPFEGVPASLGPGLRTVSGAIRSLGEKALTGCCLFHDRRIRQQSQNVARRCRRRPYGRRDVGVEQRSAGTDRFRWAAEPEVRSEIESIGRRPLDVAIGRMVKRATWAVEGIVELGASEYCIRIESVRRRVRG